MNLRRSNVDGTIHSENDVGLHVSATHCRGKILAGLPWHRDQAKLLEQAEPIHLVPDFHELAFGYTGDGDSCDSYLLAGRGVRHWSPDITSVSAMSCQAHHHLVSFRDHVLNRDMKVGEG